MRAPPTLLPGGHPQSCGCVCKARVKQEGVWGYFFEFCKQAQRGGASLEKWGAVPATEAGTPTLRSSAPGPSLFAWPGNADLTHIRDEIPKEIAFLLFGIPLGKKGEK
ncbi:hypothetical protein NN561_011169 [Cricetulus griseus]